MTRKDFQQLAELLALHTRRNEEPIIRDFIRFCKMQNPRFNPWRFEDAISKARKGI